MITQVKRFIEQQQLLNNVDGIVVGVSGGADSMCLLHILHRLYQDKIPIVAVHIHHGLRGEEADHDEAFVDEYCRQEGITCHGYRYDVPEYSLNHNLSEEEAGRILRYSTFGDECKQFNNGVIAVAHHKDDQAETVLHHFMRGTGIKGLRGMLPKNNNVIRPLLDITRQDIEEYCVKNAIEYTTDATNLEDVYTRNKIRLQLIPYIKENFNPRIVDSLCKTADLLSEDERYLSELAEKAFVTCVRMDNQTAKVAIDELSKYPKSIKTRVLRTIFLEGFQGLRNITYDHIKDCLSVMEKQTGKSITLPGGIRVERAYDQLVFSTETQKSRHNEQVCIDSFPRDVDIPWLHKKVSLSLHQRETMPKASKNHYTKRFDYDKIEYNLTLRTRQPGDFIYLTGMKGKKKLKNFFIDQKVPREQRDTILLLTHGSEVVWIIGYRENHRFKITDETKVYLEINVETKI